MSLLMITCPVSSITTAITAIAWFHAKKTASKKLRPALQKAEIFLKAFAVEVGTIEVKHWDNELRGETPADFNEKQND